MVGLLGTSLSCLQLGFRSLMAAKPWLSDPDVLEIPWNGEAASQIQHRSRNHNLYFGIMEDDGIVTPHPPVLRAVRMVKEALRAKGHKVVVSSCPLNIVSNCATTDHCLAATVP